MPPTFESPEAQRQFDKQRLAAAFRVFAMKGFDEGLAGHITVRDCIEPDTFCKPGCRAFFADPRFHAGSS